MEGIEIKGLDEGADGYRPTLNSYMFADARAIARAATAAA